jgi:N-acetyl-1-D-myo-inositol-2-amino-2-deoxy-alpha-D-glucopyranoside deacetylase
MAHRGTLMAIYAHPDDESFGTGGTLALYAEQGYRVILVTATKGEAGGIQDPTMHSDEPISELRQRELKCACDTLGIEGPHYLGYRDSGMAGTPENEHPDSFFQADLDEATGRVVEAIRIYKPEVILTFEPNGGYGHPDHIKANQVATRAFHVAGDPSRYAEQSLPAWQPKKLYYTALPRRMFRAMAQRMREAGMDLGQRGNDWENRGMPDEVISTEIDVSSVVEKKMKAFQCHRSQISPNGLISLLPTEAAQEFMKMEYFWRVVPETPVDGVERDLFEGV